jgi:predicted hotdog family 3-hydroxylacyl-ACP dehydratase
MSGFPYTMEQVLPHDRPMILLDEVLACDGEALNAAVTIHRDRPFFRAEGMPAHVAIEYMAQACGAFVGVEALRAGRRPRVGLLLGTRNFAAARRWFHDGERLLVRVEVVYRTEEMGVFDCWVAGDGGAETLALARLTVYQPSSESDLEAVHE